MSNERQSLGEWSAKSLSYFVEGAIVEFAESLYARMQELSLSKSDLAKKLNCKPSYITKVLRGSTNFTLSSMAKIAMTLNCDLIISLKPRESRQDWAGISQYQETPQRISQSSLTLLNQWPNVRGSFITSKLGHAQKYDDNELVRVASPDSASFF